METAPEVEWKEWIGGAETCNEMVFEGADGPFGGVAAMNAGGVIGSLHQNCGDRI
jgi:hypothetical protein